MKLMRWTILSHVLAIGLTGVMAYDSLEEDFETDEESEESSRESHRKSHKDSHSDHYVESYDDGRKEFHYTFESCNGKEEGSCKDGRATVENIQEFLTKEYKSEKGDKEEMTKQLEGVS